MTRLAWIGPDLLAIGTMDRGLGLIRIPRGPNGDVDPATLDQRGPLRLVDIDNGLSSRNIWTLDRIDDHLYIGSIQGVYRIALRDLPDPAATAPVAIEMQYVYAAPGRNAQPAAAGLLQRRRRCAQPAGRPIDLVRDHRRCSAHRQRHHPPRPPAPAAAARGDGTQRQFSYRPGRPSRSAGRTATRDRIHRAQPDRL